MCLGFRGCFFSRTIVLLEVKAKERRHEAFDETSLHLTVKQCKGVDKGKEMPTTLPANSLPFRVVGQSDEVI